MTIGRDLPPELKVEINPDPAARFAARLVEALEEIERAAHDHGFDDVGHLAGAARLAAWEHREHSGRKRGG